MQVDSIHVNKSCITAKQTKNKLYEDVIQEEVSHKTCAKIPCNLCVD